jgi:PAS domain S-box-containing protein
MSRHSFNVSSAASSGSGTASGAHQGRSQLSHWIFLGIALLVLGSQIALDQFETRRRIEATAMEQLANYSLVLAEEMTRRLKSMHMVLADMKLTPPVRAGQKGTQAVALNHHLDTLTRAIEGIRTLAVYDAEGTVISSNQAELVGRNFRQRKYFQHMLQHRNAAETFISEPFITALGVFTFNAVQMIPGPRGEFAGIVSATVDGDSVRALMASMHATDVVSLSLVHGSGTLLMLFPDREGATPGLSVNRPNSFFRRHMDSKKADSLMTGISAAVGTERLISMRTIQPTALSLNTPLVVAAARDQDELFAAWRAQTRFRSLMFLLFAAIAIAGMYAYLRRQQQFASLVRQREDERRQADAQSLRTMQVIKHFIDHLPGTAYVKDGESRVLMASRGFQAMLGLDPDVMIGKTSAELFPGEFGEKITADDLQVLRRGATTMLEESFGGRYFESTKFVIDDGSGGRLLGGITVDVTEQHRYRMRVQALLDINTLGGQLDEKEFLSRGLGFAKALTGSQSGFLHFVDVDQDTLELIRWDTNESNDTPDHRGSELDSELQGSHFPVSQAGIWADCVRQPVPLMLNDAAACLARSRPPAGQWPLQRLLALPIIDDGRVKLTLGVGNKLENYTDFDITTLQLIGNDLWRIAHRGRVERSLRAAMEESQRFREALDRVSASIYIKDKQFRYVYANKFSRQLFGVSADELHGSEDGRFFPPDVVRRLREVDQRVMRGEQTTEEIVLDRPGGRKQIFLEVKAPIYTDETCTTVWGLSSVSTDITAYTQLKSTLEEAQEQLLQSEKLASIGQLAAGVAHELNNPIGFVHSNLGTLEHYLNDVFEITRACEDVVQTSAGAAGLARVNELKAAKDFGFLKQDIFQLMAESKDGLARVKKIVQDLRDFSRVGDTQLEWADVHQCLDSTLNIIWNELKYTCTLTKQYAENLPRIRCVPAQLNQVFMNLLVNAAQSIETKGEITLSTRVCPETPEAVQILIADTGKGIPAENLTRIFEPFFTTKPVGKGTGLGLSIVYGIVGKHHGTITVDSTVGKGSTFCITLPIDGAEPASAPAPAPVPPAPTFLP